MKHPFFLLSLFVLAAASLSVACDSAEEAPSRLEAGTFEAIITGDVEAELAGTAIVTIDAFGGEVELFLKLQTPELDVILLSKPSLQPLAEQTYSVGVGSSDPEMFSGIVSFLSLGAEGIFIVGSGTITVDRTSAGSAEGTFELEAETFDGAQAINVEGTFNALVP